MNSESISSDPNAIFQKALALHQAGSLQKAAALYEQLLARYPKSPQLLTHLGSVGLQLGKIGASTQLLEKSLDILPDQLVALVNLGFGLMKLSRYEEALASFDRAISLNPKLGEAYSNRGNTLNELKRFEEALESCNHAIALKPEFADAYNNRGNALNELNRLEEALASYDRAIALNPHVGETYSNRGDVLIKLKRFDEALVDCIHATTLTPDLFKAHNNCGNALAGLIRFEDALASYDRAIVLKPDYAEAYGNRGIVFYALNRFEDALASCDRAIALKPDYAEAYDIRGITLRGLDRLGEAEANIRKALALKPDYAEAYGNLGIVLKDLGHLDDAEASYRRAIALKPDSQAYSNLLFLKGYHSLLDPQEYLSLARGWERSCVPEQDRQAARHRTFQREPLAGRRLRVGYVSGDYRQHAVSYFVEQLFTHHDPSRIELFAYSTHSLRDGVTERIESLVEHWVPLVGLTDSAAVERIERDGIDVLIDLSGHTAKNRLGMFARRAAPVQAYYLGYFASTGLTEMDYWIGDEILTPPDTDNHFSEQVWRLPRVSWSYDGKDAPLPNWQPVPDGTVWMGSFNQLGKLTPATLDLWAKVLHALPQGHLLIKTKELADAGNRRRILDAMVSLGISPERIELQDSSATPDWSRHMAYYNRLDIALDPVGAHGGVTTTCDALWMGVPVITLKGARVTSRATASILNAIGRPEWIAESEEEYLDKVIALAKNVEHRKELRLAQRDRVAKSQLCDAGSLARGLESAYFEMFDQWRDRQKEQPSMSS